MLRNHDFVSGLVAAFLGTWGFVYAQLYFPSRVLAYPSFVTGAMAVFGILIIIRSFREKYRHKDFGPYVINVGRFLFCVIATALYFFASTEIGFLLATMIFVPLLAWLSGYRSIKPLAIGSLVYMTAIYLVFDLAFNRPLPEGIIEKLLP